MWSSFGVALQIKAQIPPIIYVIMTNIFGSDALPSPKLAQVGTNSLKL